MMAADAGEGKGAMRILNNIIDYGMSMLVEGTLARDGGAPFLSPRPCPGDEPLDASPGELGLGRSPTFPLRQWRAGDRFRTVYFDEGDGRAIVFVHGLGGNATHWEFVAPRLARRHRVVGLDLAGCGWSLKPHVDYSVELLRDHLLDFLDDRGIGRAVLVGHSLGGAVCMAAALARPSLADSLVLLCAAGLGPLPRWMKLGAKALLGPRMLTPLLVLGADLIVDGVFAEGDDENEHVRWFRECSLHDDPGLRHLRDFSRVATDLCRDAVRLDYSREMARFDGAVLVVVGDRDRLSSLSSVLDHLDHVGRVRTVVLHPCGHMPMIERPDETLAHIERFLASPP